MQNNSYNAFFSEVINGYSTVKHSSFGYLYLKHFSHFEAGDIEIKYFEYLEEAKKNRLPTYKQQEEYIIKENLWSENDETDILLQENFLSGIKLNYSKEYLNSRRIGMKKSIDDAEIKLNALKLRKESLMSKTAESYANQKTFFYKISNSFYRDKKCLDLLNSEIEDDDLNELVKLFHAAQEKLSHTNLKKISISPFFTSIFHIANDDIYHFYGKPIIELTTHQIDLFSWGKYFKHVLSEYGASIPSNVQNNPDELMDWIDMRRNAKDARVLGDENGGGNMSIVGASKKDYEILGLQVADNSKRRQKMKEKGGILTKDDLFLEEN